MRPQLALSAVGLADLMNYRAGNAICMVPQNVPVGVAKLSLYAS